MLEIIITTFCVILCLMALFFTSESDGVSLVFIPIAGVIYSLSFIHLAESAGYKQVTDVEFMAVKINEFTYHGVYVDSKNAEVLKTVKITDAKTINTIKSNNYIILREYENNWFNEETPYATNNFEIVPQ